MTRRFPARPLAVLVLLLPLRLFAEAPSPSGPADAARALLRDGRYAEAEKAARDLIFQAERDHGRSSLEAADALDILVEAMRLGGKVKDPETREGARRALVIREERLGARHVDVARAANNLANLLVESGDYAGARPLFERALSIQEDLLGPDHELVGKTLNNLANLVSDMGDYAGSKPLYDRALRIKERAFGPDDPQLISTLVNEAILLRLMGDYAGARALVERAIAIGEARLRPGHPRTAIAIETLASIVQEAGGFSEARRLHERVLTVREKELAPDHPDLATSLSSLASLDRLSGDLPGALALLERALAIQEKSLEPDSAYMAATLVQLGEVRQQMGDAARARALFERSARILEEHFGPAHPDLATSLEKLAGLEGTPRPEAIPLLERALAIREEALGPSHPLVASTLAGLAGALHRDGRTAEAFERAARAEHVGREHLRMTAAALGDRDALRYAAHRASGLDLLVRIAAEGGDPRRRRDAWDAAIRSRALVLDEMAERHRAVVGSGDDEAARLLGELRSARARLGALAARGPDGLDPAVYRALLDQAGADAAAAERSLARRSRLFQEVSRQALAGFDDVAGALPAGSALVAWLRTGTPPRYAAFVLTASGGSPSLVSLGPADRIDSLIRQWREAAGREPSAISAAAGAAEAEYRGIARTLREALWDPLAPMVESSKRVFVVTDGPIGLMNLGTLPGPDGRYLAEDGPLIHILSAERDLLRRPAPARASGGLLAIGGPDFESRDLPAGAAPATAAARPPAWRGPTPRCQGFASLRFEPLPEAAGEVREIEAVWKRRWKGASAPSLSLMGPQAVEEAFKVLAPAYRVVHVATHGFFLEDDCSDPEDLLSESPLLRAGLALAGANRRGEAPPGRDDGILTAEEIASVDLSGVEWLVLSACETALGSMQSGEGVLGLRRASRVSGAGTLIMSLWKVKDDAARHWMRRLYEHRGRGAATDEAVRAAGLDLLAARRREGKTTHPFYWGAFVAAGDWR